MSGKFRSLFYLNWTVDANSRPILSTTVHQVSSCLSRRFSANSVSSARQVLVPNFDASLVCKPVLGTFSRTPYSTAGSLTQGWKDFSFFKFRMKYPKYVLRRSSLRLYLCCAELVDHDLFLKNFEMPDTFNSWFRITELHVWLCMVRLAQEGKEGVFLRNNMVQFLWEDVEKKTKKLGEQAGSFTARRKGIQVLNEQFRAGLFGYDEGLLSDDKVLAGALWRNLFEKNCADVAHLEKMVEYVRRQICAVDKMGSDVILTSGLMCFVPLYETPDALERNRQIQLQIIKRS